MRRRPALVLSIAIAVALASLIALVFVVRVGLPPRTIVMTTGPEGSAYRRSAKGTAPLSPATGSAWSSGRRRATSRTWRA